ncbi:MAG: DUF4850 domain-containing protein [Solirubrobacteraceae bacterium]
MGSLQGGRVLRSGPGLLVIAAIVAAILLTGCGSAESTRATATVCQGMATGAAAVSARALTRNKDSAAGLAPIYRADCVRLARREHLGKQLTNSQARRLAVSLASVISSGASAGSRRSATPAAGRLAERTCASTYGVQGSHPMPATLPSRVPAGGGLVFYANTALAVLAPEGWRCAGAVGADGSAQLTVMPVNGSQRITASFGSACVSCSAALACPVIPAAANAMPPGLTCPSHPPAAEQISRLSSTTVAFEDPPYVHGTGTSSGGPDPANGVVIYAGQPPEAYKETCTLPASQHTRCTAILNDFVGRYPISSPAG